MPELTTEEIDAVLLALDYMLSTSPQEQNDETLEVKLFEKLIPFASKGLKWRYGRLDATPHTQNQKEPK